MNKGFGLNGILIVILIILAVGTAGVYVVKKTDLVTKDTEDTTFVEEIQKDISINENAIKKQVGDINGNPEENNDDIVTDSNETTNISSEILTTNTQEISTKDYSYYKTIGFKGGVLEVTDSNSPIYGFKIEIPEGALFEDTNIHVKALDEPKNLDERPYGASFFPPIELGPEETIFSIPIHVTYLVKKETIQKHGASSLDDLPIFSSYFDDIKQRWVPNRIVYIDSINNKVTIEMDHFTLPNYKLPENDLPEDKLTKIIDGTLEEQYNKLSEDYDLKFETFDEALLAFQEIVDDFKILPDMTYLSFFYNTGSWLGATDGDPYLNLREPIDSWMCMFGYFNLISGEGISQESPCFSFLD